MTEVETPQAEPEYPAQSAATPDCLWCYDPTSGEPEPDSCECEPDEYCPWQERCDACLLDGVR
jgi:hypothetical protein